MGVVVVAALFVSDQMELPSTRALMNGMREMRMDAPTTPMVVAMISITMRFFVGNQLSAVDTSCPLAFKEFAESQRNSAFSMSAIRRDSPRFTDPCGRKKTRDLRVFMGNRWGHFGTWTTPGVLTLARTSRCR